MLRRLPSSVDDDAVATTTKRPAVAANICSTGPGTSPCSATSCDANRPDNGGDKSKGEDVKLQKNNFNAVENFDKVCIEAKEEFQLILDELWNNQLQKHLNEVLSRGKVIGFVGNLRMEVVQTEPLAIVLADSENEDHTKSKRTIELIGCARLVLSLRRGISGKIVNSHEMYTLIEKYEGKLFESAEMEIQLIKDEVSLRMTLSVLEASLEHQSLKELVAAIESAEALPTMNSQGRQLLRFAKLRKPDLDPSS